MHVPKQTDQPILDQIADFGCANTVYVGVHGAALQWPYSYGGYADQSSCTGLIEITWEPWMVFYSKMRRKGLVSANLFLPPSALIPHGDAVKFIRCSYCQTVLSSY